MPTVLVIDDREPERDEIVKRLRAPLGDDVTIISFKGEQPASEGESYEHHIAGWIADKLDEHELSLIVCDKELGLYDNLRGLSATPVSSVASDHGIPFCLYSRQADDASRDFAKYQRLRRWSTEAITLEGTTPEDWVIQIASIYRGFRTIAQRYAAVAPDKAPAAALAEILDHLDAEPRISLYGAGGQGFLMETLAFVDQGELNVDEIRRRMPRVLGNWLRLSILRFPGILVNEVAAGSYLNLDSGSMGDEVLGEAFAPAQYTGPFSDLETWWWRDDLDRILEEADVDDGLALAEKLGIDAKPCNDPQSGERAGFYCMITNTPVSAANSRSGISWFPSGADLARIRKDKFDQITALVGMY